MEIQYCHTYLISLSHFHYTIMTKILNITLKEFAFFFLPININEISALKKEIKVTNIMHKRMSSKCIGNAEILIKEQSQLFFDYKQEKQKE